jgi:hypothetical protein
MYILQYQIIYISWKTEKDVTTNTRLYYQLGAPPSKLQLEYNTTDKKNNSRQQKLSSNNKQLEKSKQYKPIEDYSYSGNSIYDNNDIDLFRNKIDDLLS